MISQFFAACFIVATLIAPITARAADGTADRAHPVAFVKDSVITTKVKAKLAAEKLRTLVYVHVDTDSNGMVVLSGNVKTQALVDKAGDIARSTEGVTSVQNDIVIQ
jgi:hyperosmotically inducible periplasmic protein